MQEMRDATFTPDMPTKKNKLTKHGHSSSRDLNDFLMDQHRFLEVKAIKNNKIKEEMTNREMQEVKLRP